MKVTQKGECYEQLSAKTVEESSLTYTRSVGFESNSDFSVKGWEDFFVSPDTTKCPVTSCEVLDKTCTNALTTVFAKATSPFAISSNTDVESGFDESVCYRCSNKDVTKDY